MKNNKSKKKPGKEIEAEEWDFSEGMGILPENISLTQNIGCVSGKTKKPDNTTNKKTNK